MSLLVSSLMDEVGNLEYNITSLKKFVVSIIIYYYYIVWRGACAMTYVLGSEDNFVEVVLFFNSLRVPGMDLQVNRLYLLNNLTNPTFTSLKNLFILIKKLYLLVR